MLNSIGLVSLLVSCYRATMALRFRIFFLQVFRGSKISSGGYLVGTKFFIMHISLLTGDCISEE